MIEVARINLAAILAKPNAINVPRVHIGVVVDVAVNRKRGWMSYIP